MCIIYILPPKHIKVCMGQFLLLGKGEGSSRVPLFQLHILFYIYLFIAFGMNCRFGKKIWDGVENKMLDGVETTIWDGIPIRCSDTQCIHNVYSV